MNRKERIIRELSKLNPEILEVKDDSINHADHYANSDESHFSVKISSKSLDNKTRVDQHKIINKLLQNEFDTGLHALSIKVV